MMRADVLTNVLIAVLASASIGCPAEEKSGPAPNRFAAVKRAGGAAKASRIFCEKTYPEGEKRWTPPPERAMPDGRVAPKSPDGWRWINFWASWCGPCLEEMPLLERWQRTMAKDGAAFSFELWSVDEEKEDLEKIIASKRRFPPGGMHWLKSGDELEGLFATLGIGTDSAIPVHALVDPSGHLRCVRVGAVGEGDYGTIKAILGGS